VSTHWGRSSRTVAGVYCPVFALHTSHAVSVGDIPEMRSAVGHQFLASEKMISESDVDRPFALQHLFIFIVIADVQKSLRGIPRAKAEFHREV